MRSIVFRSIALISTLSVGGMALGADIPRPAAEKAPAAANACARIKTSSWKATLNLQPPGPPTLFITGVATVPSTGWTLTIKPVALNKMQPPTQIVEFIATPPSGISGPVVMKQAVKGEIKNALRAYKAVSILCGKTTVATVPVKVVV
ncbi:hypothetical protein P6144_07930 [Sphingomonas sp. HITSZ_GF]|uniref:hypothetical protein n=1 Tax=Sphingomonas sp. HITSZ_GF TaxID=3037247 RepID=UPI00240DFDE0|nr:hypothetical protein [Sphingomonas sp. HITSZ_GF]MDG2533570.1 hypothetical protein [Sphingomonas sp. HITSZ_GF]